MSFTKRIEQEQNIQKVLKKKQNQYSMFRLLSIVLLIVLFALLPGSMKWFSLVGVVLFFISFSMFQKVEHQMVLSRNKEEILEKYLSRRDGSWKSFKEKGESERTLSKDLDIHGDGSLYQYLCVATSEMGRKRLSEDLLLEEASLSRAKKRQEIIKELAEKRDFRYDVEALLLDVPEESLDLSFEKEKYSFLRFSVVIMPIVLLIHFLVQPLSVQFIVAAAVVQIACAMYSSVIHAKTISDGEKLLDFIEGLSPVLQRISKEDFKNPSLVEIKKRAEELTRSFGSLKRLIVISQIRRIMLVGFLVNILFSLDGFVSNRVYLWYEKHQEAFEKGIHDLADIESLLSFCVMSDQEDTLVYPTLVDSSGPKLSFTDLKHPLIQKDQVVASSFSNNQPIVLITGSNMSGKTTFLRNVGLLLVLAYNGAPVVATRAEVSIVKLLSSIRTPDKLVNGVSSFYAEVLQMKNMVEYAKTGKPMIGLIDEIFKGTNSVDRLISARKSMKILSKKTNLVFITTHDRELSQEENLTNYYFDEYYKDNMIKFDYQLKEGVCKSSNAQFLLELAGIGEES